MFYKANPVSFQQSWYTIGVSSIDQAGNVGTCEFELINRTF